MKILYCALSLMAMAVAVPSCTKEAKASACEVPNLPVSVNRKTFNDEGNPYTGPAITLTADEEVELISDFKEKFSHEFKKMCKEKKIRSEEFSKYRGIQLESGSGNTDGSFYEPDEDRKGLIVFQWYYGDEVKTSEDAMSNAMACFADPTPECFLD